jgi:hypothetical protein
MVRVYWDESTLARTCTKEVYMGEFKDRVGHSHYLIHMRTRRIYHDVICKQHKAVVGPHHLYMASSDLMYGSSFSYIINVREDII